MIKKYLWGMVIVPICMIAGCYEEMQEALDHDDEVKAQQLFSTYEKEYACFPNGNDLYDEIIERGAINSARALLEQTEYPIKMMHLKEDMTTMSGTAVDLVLDNNIELLKVFLDSKKLDIQEVFYLAVLAGDLSMIEQLMKDYQIDYSALGNEKLGKAPLKFIAILTSNIENLKYFLKYKDRFDFNARFSLPRPKAKDRTVYHWLAQLPAEIAIPRLKLLYQHGIDHTLVDAEGKTASDIAFDTQVKAFLEHPSLDFQIEKAVFSSHVQCIDEKDFDTEVLQADLPVIVDFYADWCPPCSQMKSVLSACAEQLKGKVKFVAINVDRSQELREKYNLKGIPTLHFYAQGKRVEEQLGSAPKDEIMTKIEKTFVSFLSSCEERSS